MAKDKEPSLFRKIIDIQWEQARRRKALRLLQKQVWSVDFISTLLLKSAKMLGTPLELTVVSPNGSAMKITAKDLQQDDGRIDDTEKTKPTRDKGYNDCFAHVRPPAYTTELMISLTTVFRLNRLGT